MVVLVIEQEIAQTLEREGLLTPAFNNKRKLSTSILSSSSSSSSTSRSFSAFSVREEVDTIVIPDSLKSKETYAFIGFTEEVAEDLWQRYITKPADMEDDFIDFAITRIELSSVPDATSGLDNWDSCLRALGINDRLREAILMSEYEDIRYTASCKFWVLQALEMTYRSLTEINNIARMEQARIQRSKRTGRKHAGSISDMPSTSSPRSRKVQSSSTSSAQPAQMQPEQTQLAQTHKPTSEDESADTSTPTVATAEIPESLPGHTMIWRADTTVRAPQFYNNTTGALRLGVISMAPGDFSGEKRVAYFTPQRETADRYAGWMKHQMPISEICILQIAVPEELIRSLSVQYLWFDDQQRPTDEWKKLIWYSRRGDRLPKEMRWINRKDLLIGHIASDKNVKYENMATHTLIKDTDLVEIEQDGMPRKSIQWVFRTEKAGDDFEEQCSGKVWQHSMGRLSTPGEARAE